jgi:hypothetical protein
MTTRRELLQLVGETAAATMLFGRRGAAAAQNEARRVIPRRGRQLLELQQRFVDLRFGMFLHFNMATFQDREWGDPASSPDVFHLTALDTDQWSAGALSANMTWGCLTTRQMGRVLHIQPRRSSFTRSCSVRESLPVLWQRPDLRGQARALCAVLRRPVQSGRPGRESSQDYGATRSRSRNLRRRRALH